MFNLHKAAFTLATALTVSSLVVAGPPKEPHFDVWLRVVNTSDLVTGSITEDGVPDQPAYRVFGAEFGEDPSFPYSATEPGFQLDDGSVAPGTPFTFVLPKSISAWNGNGFSATDHTVTIEFGPQSVTTRAGFTAGFTFAADGLGGFHSHFDLTINGPGAKDPVNGVYLIPFQMAGPSGSFTGTETFWFVMNLGMSERQHDAAMDWVLENLAGAPAPCDSDTNDDGDVNVTDLVNVILNWGIGGCQ